MDKKRLKKILGLFFIWILVVNIFAVLANNRLNLTGDTAYFWIETEKYYQEKTLDLDVIHAQWDSYWLLDVVEKGYYLRGDNEHANVVFFPLYPFLIRVISSIVPFSVITIGWVISVTALGGAMIMFYKLVSRFHKKADPFWTIIFLLIFPTAYFFNAVYTESLFLFLSVSSIYYAKKDDPEKSAVFGFLAALTRITGILVFIPLLWEIGCRQKWQVKKIFNKRNWWTLSVPLGTFLFFLFHYTRFGNFFLFFENQIHWGRAFVINADHFSNFDPSAIVNLGMDILFFVFILICAYLVGKKINWGYSLYMFATVIVAVSSGTLMSIGRYILVLFPIFILASMIKSELGRFAWGLVSVLLFGFYTLLFVNHYWAG